MARRKQAAGPRKPRQVQKAGMDFSALVAAIREAHEQCAAQAKRAVNVALTMRNWLVGCYIREYEQHGADRATYGEGLLDSLAESLQSVGLTRMDARELRRYRHFYLTYPGNWESLPPVLKSLVPTAIWQSLTSKSAARPSTSMAKRIRESVTPDLAVSLDRLFSRLSFTHLAELIEIDDPLKRAFYEIECIRGNWSVRQLKRQIASLYFERSGLSKDKDKLAAMVQTGVAQAVPEHFIRDPYIFEFLGLKAQEVVEESDLEAALVAHLRDFLLELGHGFCLEAQQKSIVIGSTRGFVDLVFYHRILKCHVLVELKIDTFQHEHIGQLNTYVTWYRRNMMAEGDNPPVGVLLCTQKDHALVEYALASLDNRLFVSKYQVELPTKEALQRFLEEKRRELGEGV